jgi:hypothetical protein
MNPIYVDQKKYQTLPTYWPKRTKASKGMR